MSAISKIIVSIAAPAMFLFYLVLLVFHLSLSPLVLDPQEQQNPIQALSQLVLSRAGELLICQLPIELLVLSSPFDFTLEMLPSQRLIQVWIQHLEQRKSMQKSISLLPIYLPMSSDPPNTCLADFLLLMHFNKCLLYF